MEDLTILVDMDNVLVDTLEGFNKKWQELFPEEPFITYERISEFYIDNLYPKEKKWMVDKIWESEGFFYNLEPLPGAFEALEEISRKARVVEICTSPYSESRTGVQEKWEWVRKYLGNEWLKRTGIKKDKTMVYGDILIDDKPNIEGKRTPFWEQVIYSHPWNKDVSGKRRLTWDNWREVLTELN